MIRIVHTADLHIGADTIGSINPEYRIPDRVLDFFDTLDAIIEYAEEHDADLFIIAGDTFHRNPNPVYLSMFAERLFRISKQCCCIVLVGNHDISGPSDRSSYVDVFSSIEIPNVIVAKKFSVHRISVGNVVLSVGTIPYPDKRRLLSLAEKKGKTSEQINSLIQKKVSKIVKALEKKVSDPAILIGHLTIGGVVHEPTSLDNDAELKTDDIQSDVWRYVALGHIHKFQVVANGTTPIVYSGSIERVSFSEEHEPKGFVWVEIGDTTSYSFIEVDARPYTTIDINVPDVKDVTAYVVGKISKRNIEGHVVRVRITIRDRKRLRMNDVYTALSGAYAVSSVQVSDRDYVVTRPRIQESVSSLSKEELLEMYFEEVEAKNPNRLMKLAKEIMEEVNAE